MKFIMLIINTIHWRPSCCHDLKATTQEEILYRHSMVGHSTQLGKRISANLTLAKLEDRIYGRFIVQIWTLFFIPSETFDNMLPTEHHSVISIHWRRVEEVVCRIFWKDCARLRECEETVFEKKKGMHVEF